MRVAERSGALAEAGHGWRTPSRRSLAAVAAVAAAVWLLRYAVAYGLHLASPPPWAGAFDQSRYAASALAFAHGDLAAGQHWYALLYPLIAAPFAWLLPHEPFFLPDLALFVATVLAFAAAMRPLGLGASAATLAFLLGDAVIGKIANLWTRPWTTSLSAALFWGVIAQALAIIRHPADGAPPRPRALLLFGALAGALPLARPADAVPGVLAVLFVSGVLSWQRRLRPAALGWATLGALLPIVPLTVLHLLIYGARASDYARAAALQGFAFADLPWKTYVVVVTAAPWFPRAPSLIEVMPWIVPGLAGLGLAGWRGGSSARTALALIALMAVPYCTLTLAYTDLQPPGLWRFKNAHYFKWLFPLAAAGAWLWLRSLAHRPGAALIALLLVLAPMLLRPLPVRVPDSRPARMLLFRGATERDWNEAYFAPATITDAAGTLANVGRFHQVPDAHGERALATYRLFVGPAVRDDPGEPPPYRTAERPYARYAVRLSPGIPCWLRRQPACRIAPPPE